MAAPLIIDLAVPARDDSAGSHFFGPFVVGSNLYAVLISQSVSPPPFRNWLNVYKSTNNGLTWTSMNMAGRPNTSDTFDALLIGTVFTIVYTSSAVGNPLKVITFDTGTDTFGAPSVDGPLTNGTARVAQFSSGDLCIFFGGFGGLQQVVVFSAAAFGATVNIPNAKNSACTIVMGTNNVAQLFYNDLLAPGINVFFRTFTNGGILGAEQNVFNSSVLINTPGSGTPIGKAILWNGNFIVPYYGGANGNQAGVWTGAPYTAPVWTFTIVNPVTQGPEIPGVNFGDIAAFAFVDSSNKLNLFWITSNDQIALQISQIYFAINSGAGFGAPTLFYDARLNPPPPSTNPIQFPDFAHTLSAAKTGSFGAITAFDIVNPSGVPGPNYCAGFAILSGGPAPCPKNAQGV